jgi:hypothetical protein
LPPSNNNNNNNNNNKGSNKKAQHSTIMRTLMEMIVLASFAGILLVPNKNVVEAAKNKKMPRRIMGTKPFASAFGDEVDVGAPIRTSSGGSGSKRRVDSQQERKKGSPMKKVMGANKKATTTRKVLATASD